MKSSIEVTKDCAGTTEILFTGVYCYGLEESIYYSVDIHNNDDGVEGKYYFIISSSKCFKDKDVPEYARMSYDLRFVVSSEEQYKEIQEFFSELMMNEEKDCSGYSTLLGAQVQIIDDGRFFIYIESGITRMCSVIPREVMPAIISHIIKYNPYKKEKVSK